MTIDEETLWDVVNELLVTKGVSDPTYTQAADVFGESGIIDILGILGYYTTLSMIMNVGRTDMLDGRSPPLDPTPNYLKSLQADPLRSHMSADAK